VRGFVCEDEAEIRSGDHPRAIVLIAPFSSVLELLKECDRIADVEYEANATNRFKLFSIIPILGPLKAIPAFQSELAHGLESKRLIDAL
jgi:hypothetical protein